MLGVIPNIQESNKALQEAINLNCKVHIMNLKELTEEDKEKLKRHEIELSDENNKIA